MELRREFPSFSVRFNPEDGVLSMQMNQSNSTNSQQILPSTVIRGKIGNLPSLEIDNYLPNYEHAGEDPETNFIPDVESRFDEVYNEYEDDTFPEGNIHQSSIFNEQNFSEPYSSSSTQSTQSSSFYYTPFPAANTTPMERSHELSPASQQIRTRNSQERTTQEKEFMDH